MWLKLWFGPRASSYLIGALVFCVLSTAHAAAQAPRGNASDFGIYGSNTIGARLMPALIEAYAASIGVTVSTATGEKPEEVSLRLSSHDGATIGTIAVQSHGSGTAVPALLTGKAAVGMMSRPIDDKEAQQVAVAGKPDFRAAGSEHILALDGLLILTSPKNPIKSLTMDQLAAIFSGQIKDWSELGLANGAIAIYARDDKSGTFDTFNALVLKPRKLTLVASAKRLESSEQLSDDVANDPRAIGFVGFAYHRNAKAISVENDCGVTISPTAAEIKTEVYPLARRLYLYTDAASSPPAAKNLLKFALSSQARDAVASAGFIDQELELPSAANQLARVSQGLSNLETDADVSLLKELATSLKSTARLSVSLFFRNNSSVLDSKGLSDVQRIGAYVHELATSQPGKKVIIAGFTDARGPFATNAELSRARAEAVRKAILRAAGTAVSPSMVAAKGFGELLPLRCQATVDSFQRNRRVEIWVQ